MTTYTALRGFRDYLPPEAGARSELRRRMRAVARRCGYVELETPAVESLELFEAKSGTEIAEQAWAFTDKGGRRVALTPETTPSLARVFVERAKSEPLPVKWFTISKLWRYEEPQAGRTREFMQLNLDILGVPGVEAEADILASSALLLDELGAQDLYAFRVNDRALVEGLAGRLGVTDRARFFRTLDRQKKIHRETVDAELRASGLGPEALEYLQSLISEVGNGLDPAAARRLLTKLESQSLPIPAKLGIDRLGRLFDLIDRAHLEDRVVFDPSVVRGLAYYTGTVFEAYDRRGDARSLFGGGRYDQLIELFGGPPVPACGLAIGDQTLELLLKAHERWPQGEPGLDTYVVGVSQEQVPLAFEWVEKLRRAGISADSDLMNRSLSRQLKEAHRRKARRALILGPKELERGVLVERDLTTGEQRELAPSEVLPPA